MTTTAVVCQPGYADGSPAPSWSLSFVVAGADGKAVTAYLANSPQIRVAPVKISGSGGGAVEVPLTPNVELVPAGTRWRMNVVVDGHRSDPGYLNVGVSAVPVQVSSILSPAPASVLPAGAAAQVELNAEATTRAAAITAEAATRAAADTVLTAALADKLSTTTNAFSRTRYYASQQTQGNVLGAVYRTRHRALTAGYGAILRFGNIGGTATLAEGSIGNDITIKVAIEDSAGVITPVFFRGQRSITFNPGGGLADSDPVGIEWVAGAIYFVRAMVTVVATGQFWPTSTLFLRPHLGEGIVLGTTTVAPTDLVDSGTITAAVNQTTSAYGPLAILSARPVANPVILAVYGDSIGVGIGDQTGVPGGGGDLGYVARALLRANVPMLDGARAGDQQTSLATPQYRRQRFRLTQGATHAIDEMGRNDFNGGASMATMQSRSLAAATALRLRGAAPRFATITPSCSSTDQFITVSGQTPSVADGPRTAYNDWLRAGAPINPTTLAAVAVGTAGALLAGQTGHPMAGYFEAADLVESARNSGKWVPYMTYDGLHPAARGHKALAAAIDTTLYGAAAPVAPAFPSFAGLKFRYNFALTGLANGAAVASVPDLGPNGWTLTPAGAGTDPVYSRDGFFGHSGVLFSNAKTLNNTSVAVNQPDTIIAVIGGPSALTYGSEPFDGLGSRQRFNPGTAPFGGAGDIYAGAFLALPAAFPYNPAFAPAAIGGVFNGGSSKVILNDYVSPPGNAGANNLGGLTVGFFYPGAVLELMAWDHDVTAVPAEWAAVLAYLAYAYDLDFAGQPSVY